MGKNRYDDIALAQPGMESASGRLAVLYFLIENFGLSGSPGIRRVNWSIGFHDSFLLPGGDGTGWCPNALGMIFSIRRSRYSFPPRDLDFMKSAS